MESIIPINMYNDYVFNKLEYLPESIKRVRLLIILKKIKGIASGNAHTLRDIGCQKLEYIVEELHPIIKRKCSMCEEKLEIGEYIKTNFIYKEDNIPYLINLWNNKNVKLQCCLCTKILQEVTINNLSSSFHIYFIISTIKLLKENVKSENIEIIIKNLIKYGFIS